MALNLTTFSSASFPIWANKKEKVWLLHPLAPMDVSNRTTLTYKGNNPHLDPLLYYNESLCPSPLWTLSQASLGQRTSPALPFLILQVTNPFTRTWCMGVVSSVLTPEPNVGWSASCVWWAFPATCIRMCEADESAGILTYRNNTF